MTEISQRLLFVGLISCVALIHCLFLDFGLRDKLASTPTLNAERQRQDKDVSLYTLNAICSLHVFVMDRTAIAQLQASDTQNISRLSGLKRKQFAQYNLLADIAGRSTHLFEKKTTEKSMKLQESSPVTVLTDR